MLVPHVAGLEGIGLHLHLADQIDDVFEPQVVCGSDFDLLKTEPRRLPGATA
jgi:hypothetical protein